MILDSSMVEHSAVNRVVVGSSPTRGALGRGTGHYGGIRDGFFVLPGYIFGFYKKLQKYHNFAFFKRYYMLKYLVQMVVLTENIKESGLKRQDLQPMI